MDQKTRHAYWEINRRYVLTLLFCWALVSFGLSILFVDHLDRVQLGSFKLGFWFAQQGSIFSFVIIIFVYIYLMNRLDKRFGMQGDKS